MGIKEDGFVLIRNAFDKEDICKILNDIEQIFQTYEPSKLHLNDHIKNVFANDFDGFIGCANSCQYLPSLFSLASSPKMIEILNSLGLNLPVINTRPLLSFSSKNTSKNENYWKIPAHQDWPSMQGSLNGITCWIPLIDVTNEMGALEICPKSHLFGKIAHLDNGVPFIEDFTGTFESFPIGVGDALFFNVFTVHRSGNNITDKIRISAHFRYDDCNEKTFIERKFPRHRIEKRKDGDANPNFPKKEIIQDYFSQKQSFSETQSQDAFTLGIVEKEL